MLDTIRNTIDTATPIYEHVTDSDYLKANDAMVEYDDMRTYISELKAEIELDLS